MRRCALALVCLSGPAMAEMWPPLADYVSLCVLIVRAEVVAGGQRDPRPVFRVRETWKGRFDPALLGERWEDGCYATPDGEHGVDLAGGADHVFFFTRVRDGKLAPHSTAFPIRDGKVVYAPTSRFGLREELSVEEFRRRVRESTQAEADTGDLRYRLRIVHMERTAPDLLSVQAVFEPLDRSAHPDLLLEESLRARAGPLGPDQALLPRDGSFEVFHASRTVVVRRIPVDAREDRLPLLAIECCLVHVREWKDLVFPDLGRGPVAPLHCGPFELLYTGEEDRCVVCAAALAQHEEEHRAFRERVALRLVNHRWALGALRVQDAAGNLLALRAGGGTGGATSGHFHPARGDPAYPVTLRLRLPLRWELERRVFRFADLELPPTDGGR